MQRFSFAFLMLLSAALLILGRAQPQLVENLRSHAIDVVAPVVDGLHRPFLAVGQAADDLVHYFTLRSENEQLRAANAQMKEWQNAVAALQKENHELHNLLHFKTEPGLAYISARVIADTGGAFTRGLIVTAGKSDGVREGMAAMTGEGLIGTVTEVGDWSSRIVLITDLNSRIPVTIAGSGDRAIVSGDNSPTPRLRFLPQDAVLSPGASVVTSGHGGIFPPNLPVGHIVDHGHNQYSVIPAADLARLNYVRLVDFNLRGGAFNPVATRVNTEARARKN